MTPEERKEMDRLCRLIKEEKDHHKFLLLVRELNNLFELKQNRLEPPPETPKDH